MNSIKNISNSQKRNFPYLFINFLGAFIIFLSLNSYSQNQKLSFQEADQNSYTLYAQQNWDSLISYCNYALENNHDYFNLRLRLGIAYYNKANYYKATAHLLKANNFSKNDPVTMEYLQLSYLYSNRILEANSLAKKQKILESVNFETGPIFSDNIEKNKQEDLIGSNQGEFYGEQDLNDQKYYTQLGIKLSPVKKVSFYFGYNNLLIDKLKQIEYQYIPIGPQGILPERIEKEFKYKLHQNGIYANMNVLFADNFILTPAIHYINVKYTTIYLTFPQNQFGLPKIVEQSTNLDNLVLSLGLSKTISVFNMGIFGSYSDLNYKEQYQAGGSFSWFPKGNLDIYTTSKLVFAWEEEDNRTVFDQLIGYKAMSKLWLEASVTFGEILDYNENNAYVVYNSGDKINVRATGNIIVPLNDHFELSLRYHFVKFEGEWYKRSVGVTEAIKTEYNNHLIMGGLKWTL